MSNYYVRRTAGGVLIGGARFLADDDPDIAIYTMLPCTNYNQFDPLTNKIVSRSVVDEQVVYVFDDYTPSALELSAEKNKRKNVLYQSMVTVLRAGFVTSYDITMDCMADDVNNIRNAIDLLTANQEQNIVLLDYNESQQQLTLEQLNQIFTEILDYRQTLMEQLWGLYVDIDNCTTISQVRAIVWS